MAPQPQSALDVAEYFLWLAANEQPDDPDYLTPSMLQRLLYFAQGWAMVEWGGPLFREEIKATQNGPVVAEVAAQHLAAGPILSRGRTDLPGEPAGVVRSVWNYYKRFSGSALRGLVREDPVLTAALSQSGQTGAAVVAREAMKAGFQARLDDANRRLAARATALQRLAERNSDIRRRSAG